MTHFYRLSGGGNDFLALAEPAAAPEQRAIDALCRRGLSAGADGLFILERRDQTVRMRHFNADGYPAELCLNGTRCAVRLATHLGWGDSELVIETDSGPIRGWPMDSVSVTLVLPRPEDPHQVDVEHDGAVHSGWHVTVGVPHFVLPWTTSLAAAPVADLGSALRRHPRWGDTGANINFVRYVEPHRFEIRTFERGVEAETLACGSGVMASTAVGLETDTLVLPAHAQTLGGFELVVGPVEASDSQAFWSLAGDARLIAEGTLHPASLDVPQPPSWTT